MDLSGRPNVLIFMPDQQNGATVLPGSPVIKPHLDRFLTESVTFTNAYCPAPHCCPSRASFMSGLYPSEHGVYNNVSTNTAIHANPYPGTPYWGNWLKAAGYEMGYSGKLHVGRDVTPEDCGFTTLCSLQQDYGVIERDAAAGVRRGRTSATARKPGEIVRPGWGNLQLYQTTSGEGREAFANLDDSQIVKAGIDGIKSFAKGGKPWCIMISNMGAHDTYDVPREFVDLYRGRPLPLSESFADTMEDKPRIYQRQRLEYWSQLTDEESRAALLHYYAKCSMQDALFGQILAALDEVGARENTIVIYVSDHGDYSSAHGLWMKGVPSFKEAYHIPAIVRWPKGISGAGRQVDALVAQVDWAATILEACGVPQHAELSGSSLMPWLKSETPEKWRDALFTQMNGVELYYTQRIVMSKDWKYVYNGFDFDELYDLKKDPHEMVNLAFPDHYRTNASEKRQRTTATPWPFIPPELDAIREALLEQLWAFAEKHNDIIFNSYGTVALAPYGPDQTAAVSLSKIDQRGSAAKKLQ